MMIVVVICKRVNKNVAHPNTVLHINNTTFSMTFDIMLPSGLDEWVIIQLTLKKFVLHHDSGSWPLPFIIPSSPLPPED